MPHQIRIDVGREFAHAVKRCGGEVLDEILGGCRDYENADYLFRDEHTIAELKCLDEDKTADPAFCAKLSAIYRRLLECAPSLAARKFITLQEIANADRLAAFDFIEVYKQRLQALVKKANRQLKETAVRLNIPNPKGLLLLVNDGDRAFELDTVLFVLHHLMKDHFSSVNAVIYFTVNETSFVPGIHHSARLWMPIEVPTRAPISGEFTRRLFDAWANHMATTTGEPVGAICVAAPSEPEVAHVKLTNGRNVRLQP